MGYGSIDTLITEHKCSYCGKTFVFSCPPGMWTYKTMFRGRRKWFCRYSHMVAGEREFDKMRKFRKAHV